MAINNFIFFFIECNLLPAISLFFHFFFCVSVNFKGPETQEEEEEEEEGGGGGGCLHFLLIVGSLRFFLGRLVPCSALHMQLGNITTLAASRQKNTQTQIETQTHS